MQHACFTMNVWPSDLVLFGCRAANTIAPPAVDLVAKLPERKKKSIDVSFVEVLLRKAERVNILAWCHVQDTVAQK